MQGATAHTHKNWECHCSHCTVDSIFPKASTHQWKENKYISTHPWHFPTKQDCCSDPLGISYSLYFIFSGITWQKLNQFALIHLFVKFIEIQFRQLWWRYQKNLLLCVSIFFILCFANIVSFLQKLLSLQSKECFVFGVVVGPFCSPLFYKHSSSGNWS